MSDHERVLSKYKELMTVSMEKMGEAQLLILEHTLAQARSLPVVAGAAPTAPKTEKAVGKAAVKADKAEAAGSEEAVTLGAPFVCKCSRWRGEDVACPNPTSKPAKSRTKVPKTSDPNGPKTYIELTDACKKEYTKKMEAAKKESGVAPVKRERKTAAAAGADQGSAPPKKSKIAPPPAPEEEEEEENPAEEYEEEQEEEAEIDV